MKIAVCDDEPVVIQELIRYLKSYYGEEMIVDSYTSGKKLLESNEKYSVMFLDIAMEGMSGVELAERIRKTDRECMIIFVTNYDEHYQRAFSVHAFEYVLKPISEERIFKVLNDISAFRERDTQEEYIYLKTERGMMSVQRKQIHYFEYTGRKVKMVMDTQSVFVLYTLKELKTMFEPHEFDMPHRAFIINLRKVELLKQYEIILENGDSIPIAQKKAAAFRKAFEQYLVGRAQL